MNANRLDAYVFTSPEHWARCLQSGFARAAAGGLTQPAPLGLNAWQLSADGPATRIAAGRNGVLAWRIERDCAPAVLERVDENGCAHRPIEIGGMLARSSRLLLERDALWAFRDKPPALTRYDRHTLEADFTIDAAALLPDSDAPPPANPALLDIATDGRGGAWLLLHADKTPLRLLHVDCKGRRRDLLDLPRGAGDESEIACVARGASLALLDKRSATLWIVPADAAAQDATREYRLSAEIGRCTSLRMTSDGANALAIGGLPAETHAHWSIWLFDAEGQWRDGPLTPFSHAPDIGGREPHDFALHDDAVWFARRNGVWKLDSSDACIARAADGWLMTPALQSPEPGLERGWLRAELSIDLPAGASVEADYISTDDDVEAARIVSLAKDWRRSAAERIALIGYTAAPSIAPVHIGGPQRAAQPVGIPLFRTSDRWLWLRLRITTPPGGPRTHIGEMRVLYPNRSLERFLPHAFRGGDPSTDDFLRRLLGVLEATTQSIDARIASIGAHIDPRTAPDAWLDTLGGWLALPWDDALPAASKRGVLTNAAALLAARGTREGTRLLLESLLGAQAVIRIDDLTADHPLIGLGGAQTKGPAFPVLLAGVPARIAKTNRSSRLNRTSLACGPGADDPLLYIVPTLSVTIRASHDMRAAIAPVLASVLAQYVPAGVRVRIGWRPFAGPRMTPLPADALMVLDAQGPGVLDLDSVLGRTVLATRAPGRIGRDGLDLGFRIE